MRVHKNWIAAAGGLLLLAAAVVLTLDWRAWRHVPLANTAETKFDVILVLGSPSRTDCTPSSIQRVRVMEGVRRWRAGVASRMIVSGGAAHNRCIEAQTMGQLAVQAGVPTADVFEEQRAMNTIQNVYYSVAIMRAHGWHTVDVVSSWYHLPRAALILMHFPVLWRLDAAPWPRGAGLLEKSYRTWREVVYTSHLLRHGFKPSRFISR